MVAGRDRAMSRDTSFYYSFLVLPAEQRRAIVAVWDFCRAVDDTVDQPSRRAALPSSMREAPVADLLRMWRHEVACCFGEGTPQTAHGRHLLPFVSPFHLPRQAFEDLIDGVEMDLVPRRYATFDELREYCLRVASAVGLVCVEIFGYRNPIARDYAIDLGIALQLTNIIRDLRGDLAEGRLYLPMEDLDRFGCTEDDLRRGALTDPVRSLLRFQCTRARQFYQRAADLLPREDARRLVAAEIMGGIYFGILQRIERAGYDVFSSVIRVSRPARALIVARVWTRAMMGLAPLTRCRPRTP
jgi:phytoene synthase